MAAPYNPPVKGEDFTFRISLGDMTSPGAIKSSPTIASGDFYVITDGATAVALVTSSTTTSYVVGDAVNPKLVKIYLSATDMNGDNVTLLAADQTSPKEWADLTVCIVTTSS